MSGQMPLGLAPRERASFDNYVPGANLAALEHLRRYTGSPGEPALYLHGPAGSGRTHLVQAVCSAAAARGQTTVRLGLAAEERLPLAALDGLENLGVVCIEDLDAVAGERAWEAALDTLCARLAQHGGGLVMTGALAPAEAGFAHAGLARRVGSAMDFALAPLDPAGLAALLAARAGRLGLALPKEVAALLLRHCADHPCRLIAALDALERALPQARGRLGVAGVRALLRAEGLLAAVGNPPAG